MKWKFFHPLIRSTFAVPFGFPLLMSILIQMMDCMMASIASTEQNRNTVLEDDADAR